MALEVEGGATTHSKTLSIFAFRAFIYNRKMYIPSFSLSCTPGCYAFLEMVISGPPFQSLIYALYFCIHLILTIIDDHYDDNYLLLKVSST